MQFQRSFADLRLWILENHDDEETQRFCGQLPPPPRRPNAPTNEATALRIQCGPF